MSSSSIAYRPEIDGLRAIAVMLVVTYHLFPTVVPGGFVGVDVFFVISGYLITGIINSELAAHSFSFGAFYAKRVRRIFPALALVLLLCLSAGWFLMLSDELMLLGKHVAAGSVFSSNLLLASEVGYFDRAAATKPLLHLWSLGIEEQFYIVWPVLLVVASRLSARLPVVAAICIGSFIWSAFAVHSDPGGSFYSMAVRAWELALGGLLALLSPRSGGRVDAMAHRLLPGLGLVLICASALLLKDEYPFPGPWALLPAVGGALIIAGKGMSWIDRRVLASPAAIWLGRISYPLYLWHWPMLTLGMLLSGGSLDSGPRLAIGLFAVALADLTYRFVERPLRTAAMQPLIVAGLCAAMAVAGLSGLVMHLSNGFPARVAEVEKVARASLDWFYPGNMKPLMFGEHRFLIQRSRREETTLFVGDSNVMQYYPRIDKVMRVHPDQTNSVVFASEGGCLPIPHLVFDQRHPRCNGLVEAALEWTKATPSVRHVVIAAQWNGQLSGENHATRHQLSPGSTDYQWALEQLRSYIAGFVAIGRQVHVVLNIPVSKELDPKQLVRRDLLNFPKVLHLRSGGIERAALIARYGAIQDDIARVAREAGATVIDPIESLCSADRCPSVDPKGEPMYRDEEHLRPAFVRNYLLYLDETFRKQ